LLCCTSYFYLLQFEVCIYICFSENKNLKHSRAFQQTLRNIKKLSEHNFAYRIRFGRYRIGVFIKDNTVEFANFDHRSRSYKIFP